MKSKIVFILLAVLLVGSVSARQYLRGPLINLANDWTANRLLHAIPADANEQVASVADLTDYIAGTAGEVDVVDDGTGGVVISLAGGAADPNRYIRANLPGPAALQAADAEWCIVVSAAKALHIKEIHLTCDANPAAELDIDLKVADAFIGLANAAVLAVMDTTNGAYSSGAVNIAVSANKTIYISFGAAPDAAITQIGFQARFQYD